jgi:CRP-like cAMP-binding protein
MFETPDPPIQEGLSSLERMLMLKKLPSIGDLPSADLAVIADVTRERFFPKGSLLLSEGEAVIAAHLVVDGAVEARRGGVAIGTIPAGFGVGALGLFAGDRFGVDVVAIQDTRTLEIEGDLLFEVFEDRFSLMHHVLRDVSRQLVEQVVALGLDPSRLFSRPLDAEAAGQLDLVDRIFFLRRMPVFAKASINTLFEMSRGMTEIRFPPGTTLWKEGEAAPGVFLVTGGRLRCRSAAGLDFVAGVGFPMGAAEAMAEMPRWYEAVTLTTVTGLQGPVETLIDLLEDNFELARDYLAGITRGLIAALEVRYRRGGGVPVLGIAGAPDRPGEAVAAATAPRRADAAAPRPLP